MTLKLARGPRPPTLKPRPPEILAGAGRALRAYVPIFLGWFDMARGMSPLSVRAYQDGLKSFLTFCDLHGLALPKQVTPIAVEAFMATLRAQGRKASTVNHRRYVLITFFKFLQSREAVESNPAKLAAGMRMSRSLPGYFPSVQQRPIFEDLIRDRSTLGLRNLAVSGTFLLCGLRVAELAALRLSDLDLSSKMLKVVQGKGGRDRFVVVIPWLREVLTQYLEVAHPALLKGREADHVFLSRTGRPMCSRTLWSLVSRVLSPLAGKHVHPHMLRHSFASRVIAAGGNIVALQKGMGHTNLDTTSIYTHLPDDLYVRQFTSWLSGESPEPEPPATLPPGGAEGTSVAPLPQERRRGTLSSGGLHRHDLDRDPPRSRPLLQPARDRGAVVRLRRLSPDPGGLGRRPQACAERREDRREAICAVAGGVRALCVALTEISKYGPMSAHRRGVERVDRPAAQFVHPFRYVEGSEERERAARWQLGGARSRDVTPLATATEIALDCEESLHPDLRLPTHVSDLMTTVEEVLRLVGWLKRVAGRSIHRRGKERTIP